MHAAKPFVVPSWQSAFESIDEASGVLVAGTAAWTRVTHRVLEKRRFRREPKPKLVTEDPAELAYYIVTEAGLHVGQARPERVKASEPGFSAPVAGSRVDYFVPRGRVVSVGRWEVGAGGVMAKAVLEPEGACVDICFLETARQFSGDTEGELPALKQRENVIRALVDGVAPIVETATKVCPDCAEDVKYLANVCRFCGYRFDSSPQPWGAMLRALASRLAERISEQPRLAALTTATQARPALDEPEEQNGHRALGP